MDAEKVYITANPTPNPDSMKFIVDRRLVDGSPVSYGDPEAAEGSPLAEKLFALGHVKALFAFQNFITVTKGEDIIWQEFARTVGQTIREHIQSGAEVHFLAASEGDEAEDSEAVSRIKAVLEEIRPSVAADGGNIVFAGYRDGIVSLFMQGSCSGCPSAGLTLKAGIENRLKQVLPEVREVVAVS